MADKQKTELNKEQVMSFLKENVGKIRTEEDPFVLNEYRALFRKAVPFTMRSYFAAYLLKQYFDGKPAGKNGVASRNERYVKGNKKERAEIKKVSTEEPKRAKQNENRQPHAAPEVRPVLAEDVSSTLFLSIGRNRRVYPRDLIGLIMQTAEIEREHIGEIRVLDNYSFVQVLTEEAEKIISLLNDFEYRGRKLAVSYSRKRDEETDLADSTSASETDVSDNEEDNADI